MCFGTGLEIHLNMDRELPKYIKIKRRRNITIYSFMTIGLIVSSIWFLRNTFQNSVDGQRLLIATAEMGPIESTITASGEVIPEYEHVITSSIQANIQEVLASVGTVVEPGMPILQLDKSFALIDYEKLEEELKLKENSINKLRLDLQQKSHDLKISDSTKGLDIVQLTAELDDAIKLRDIGGGSQEAIDQIKTKLKKVQLEKRKLEYDLSIEEKQTQLSIRELQLQANIQRSSINTMQEKLDRANVVAQRKGVLTWVNENLGTTVQEGEILARIANLSSFKIVGTCSNIYADQVLSGQRVIVQLNNEETTLGTIVQVRPTVENNVLTFDVQLDKSNHAQLRPNMRTEIFVITASKQNVVRVTNGPAFKGTNHQNVFIVDGENAVSRAVKIGLHNFDYVELESNVQAGEKVIISDMERFEGLSNLKIK